MDLPITQTGSMDAAIEGGFANPVFDAQLVFNKIMNAMARPGSIAHMGDLAKAPAPIFSTTAAIISTLCDSDTPVWTDIAQNQTPEFSAWLSFQTAAQLCENPGEAAIAIVSNAVELPSLSIFSQGVQEYPDRSATVVIQVEALNAGDGLLLKGPGIKDVAMLSVEGLPGGFIEDWRKNRSHFPLGVDVILASSAAITCLPRTVNLMANSDRGTN